MISVEKPGSPSEILEHAGVKGMKWGVRQSRQASKKFGEEFPTGKSRAQEIRRARVDQEKRKKAFINAPRGSQQRVNLKKAYLNNPDAITQMRITRGEKIVGGLVLGVFGVTGVVPLAVGTAGATAYTVRRSREKKLAKLGIRE